MKIILQKDNNKLGLDEEIAPYKRKKESTTSKSSKKSKHKHEYKKCLLRTDFEFNGKNKKVLHVGRVCTICGKTHIDQYFVSKKTEDRLYLMLDYDEIIDEYPDLEIIDIEE